MKILFLPKQFPHERVVGGPILVYNRIKHLSKRHEVHLLTFLSEEERRYLRTVETHCRRLESVGYPRKKTVTKQIIEFLFSRTPPYMLTTHSREMENKLGEMAEEERYDAIIAEYSVMGQYLYNLRGRIPESTVKVISVHECYTVARRAVFELKGLSKEGITAYLHYLRLKGYEFEMYRSADKILTLSEEDRRVLLKFEPSLEVQVVPHGVDTETFHPRNRRPTGDYLCFLGNYRHEPNVDAVLFFYDEVFPKVRRAHPEARFLVVGQDPPEEVKALSQDRAVSVTGYVPDVRPYLNMSKIFVAPIRLGGGVRGKTLEALSSGMPIVSTSIGVAGTGGVDGIHFLKADDPTKFAERTISILDDEELAEKLSVNGRRLAEKFSYERGVEKLERILENNRALKATTS